MHNFNFSYLIQCWLLPPGINILLLVTGSLFYYASRRLGLSIIVAGIISLWLLSTPLVAYNLINTLQNKYPLLQPTQIEQSTEQQAIVVLGGGDKVEAEYNHKHTVSDATWHRLRYAAFLYDKTHLPVIVSGGRSIAYSESEADLMADILWKNYKIKAAFKEDKSLNTADEATYLAPLLKQHHYDKIYLVTNAWHMPRSVAIFHKAGINVMPAPMGYYVYGPGYAWISILPNIEALSASSVAIHEYLGLFWSLLSNLFRHESISL